MGKSRTCNRKTGIGGGQYFVTEKVNEEEEMQLDDEVGV